MELREARPRDIANVQALRAVAALMVSIGHGAHPGIMPLTLNALLSSCAYAGVDVFFVISGFIVTRAASRASSRVPHEGRIAPAFDFAGRRFFRIFPLYWIVLAVAIASADWIDIAPQGWPRTPLMAMASLTSIWITPLSSAWTLAFEVYFYAVLAIIILLAGRFLQPALGLWMALQTAWVFAPHTGWLNGDIGPSALVLEFGLGWIIGMIAPNERVAFVLPAGILATSLWIAGMWLTARQGLLSPVPRVATFGVASAFLLHALLRLDKSGFRAPVWLRSIGDASYSIYLWHLVLFGALYALYPAAGLFGFSAAVLCLIACGLISHALIELPAQRFGTTMVQAVISVFRPAMAS